MSRWQQPGRADQRGSAAIAVLVLLGATLLVAVGARLFGGAAVEKLRCQGEAVQAIGGGAAAGCGGGGQQAFLGRSPAPTGAGGAGRSPPEPRPRPIARADLVARGSASALAPLFQIVEEGAERTAENQVTEDEFAAIVDLYDAVRNERAGLQHTDRAAPYLHTIMNDVALILQTEGGRKLIDLLARHGWTFLSIAFRTNEDGEADPTLGLETTNAWAEFDGESALVKYAPGEKVRVPGIDLELNPWAEWRSDVTLYHELIHAADYIAGTRTRGRVQEDGEWFDAMEYRAIGIGGWEDMVISENSYRAARRKIAERGIGAVNGDADMPIRPRYIPLLPPADPPGPRPRPDPDDRFWHLDER